MAKIIQAQRDETPAILKKTKDGRIQKKTNDMYSEIPIEKKTYKISQLTALEGKFKKINTELSVDEEKNEGRSIMVNMKTSAFEVMKRRFLGLLEKHPQVKNASLVRTAKAQTEDNEEADMEYHIDVEIVIEGNEHKIKLKVFNSNCRIQVQHAGKHASHLPKEHLKNKSPPRFFAEEIILPLCKTIDEAIPIEKEKDFVTHLRNEIQRLKKSGRNAAKVARKGKCINSDCSSRGNLDMNNMEKYGTCLNCKSQEHFRCANIEPAMKLNYQDGSLKYLCTECLSTNPALAIQQRRNILPITVVEVANTSVDQEKVLESPHDDVHRTGTEMILLSEINNDSNNTKVNQERNIQCDECYLYVLTKDQLRTHKRLKHEEVINYRCEYCTYSCCTTNQLNEHPLHMW